MAIYNLITLNEKGEVTGIPAADIGLVNQLAFGTLSAYTIVDKADIDNLFSTVTGGDVGSLHNHDGRYFTKTELTNTGVGSRGADLLSATPVLGASSTTVQGQLGKIEERINLLEGLGQDWQDSVITTTLTAPPLSPGLLDRYLIGTQPGLGVATGAWAGQDGTIATWTGTNWEFTVNSTGKFTTADDEPGVLYYFNGTVWLQNFFETTTASGFLTVTNGDVRLTELEAAEIIVGQDNALDPIALDTLALGQIIVDPEFGLIIKDGIIDGVSIAPGAGIELSKIETSTAEYMIVADATGIATYVPITGDINVATSGQMTIQPASVDSGKIDFGSAAGQVNDSQIPTIATVDHYTPAAQTIEAHLESINSSLNVLASDVSTETTNRTNEDLTFLKLDGSRAMTANLNMDGNELDAVLRTKTDTIANQNNATVLTLTGTTELRVDRQITMGDGVTPSYKIVNVAQGVNANDVVVVGQVPALTSGKVDNAGDTMTGILNMGNNRITNVFDGSASGDAVNKGQLDSVNTALDTAKVNKAGDTMSGTLNMNANKITNLLDGTNPTDAVNKSQLDSVSANVGALTTDDVAEASNLYYTTARFDTAFAGKSTDDLAEGANLYFTDERVDDRVSALVQDTSSVSWSYDDSANTLEATVSLSSFSTTDLAEGSNLYYTDARADARIAAQKAQPNGLATLDGSGLIPSAQLPSFVDDVLEFADLASFPATGETGKIYIALDTNLTYRWSGSIYVEVGSNDVNSVNGQTGIVVLTTTEIAEGTNLYYTDTRFDDRLALKTTDDLTEGANLYYTDTRFDNRLATKTTDDVAEGANLYYTEARVSANADVTANTAKVSADGSIDTHSDVDVTSTAPTTNDVLTWDGNNWVPAPTASTYSSADFDTDFAAKDTDDLTEGAANFYYTETRFDTSLSAKTTDDLAQGSTNRYYSSALFDSDLAGKTTSNLAEGTNLYFTDARARTAAVINNTSGNETDQAASVAAMKTYVTNVAPIFEEEIFVLTAQNITDGYVDLQQEAITKSEKLWVQGGNMRVRGDDFTVSVPSTVSRITFAGSLASTLVAGNKIVVSYAYYA
jgi:hypothetical protein